MSCYRCSICLEFIAESIHSLTKHIGRIHRNEPNFHVVCGIESCAKTYRNFWSFRNHLTRVHHIAANVNNYQKDRCPEAALEDDSIEETTNVDENTEPEEVFNIELENEKLTRSNALCLLKFKEKASVPQTRVNYFVENVTHITKSSVDSLKFGVEERLKEAGIDLKDVPGLIELFEGESLISNPFLGISKESSQKKYYEEHFGLVEPKRIALGRHFIKKREGDKLKSIEKKDEAIYVPLLDSLQQLLNDDSILYEVENPHERHDQKLCDYCDGETFKNHPLFSSDPLALQLLLYFDEVEICNPLGSRANKHKLGAFYYTLGNIRPEFRSHLNAIQLLGLVNTKHLKKYGVNAILEVFMEDLHKLEQDDGFEFIIKGEVRCLRGTIAFISGDNLGSQLIGGFKQGSQSHRKCRVCMGDSTDISEHFHEDYFVMRTKESYATQCQRLDQGEHFRKTYGLNQYSVLNNSRYFHVIGGLPCDAMHDVLEGVLQYVVKELLKTFIHNKKYFSLEDLNRRILAFDYGYNNDTNKPMPIQPQKLASDDNSLKQHANQMWCLGLHLPFLIGDYVPEDDEHWDLYGNLLQILRIVFSPLLSKQQVAYLQVLVQQLLEKFKEVLPNSSIIPKMHYMIHMARTILELGPLVRSWCMRYEAKHHYLKKLAVAMGNFINLPLSLARRHQEGVAYRLQTSEGGKSSFLHKNNDVGPGKKILAGDAEFSEFLKDVGPGIVKESILYQAKWITINGTKYKKGAIVHFGFDEDDFPQFWQVQEIVIVNEDVAGVMFVVDQKETLQFSEHFHAYEVCCPRTKHQKIIRPIDLTCHLPMSLIKPFRSRAKFVCLRYEVDKE